MMLNVKPLTPSQVRLVPVSLDAVPLDTYKSRLLWLDSNRATEVWNLVKLEGSSLTLNEVKSLIDSGVTPNSASHEEMNEVLGTWKALSYITGLRDAPENLDIRFLDSLHYEVKTGNRFAGVRRSSLYGEAAAKIVMRFGGKEISFFNPEDMPTVERELFSSVLSTSNILEYAFNLCCMLTYYQLYTDGNKRTSRLFLNSILIQNGFAPISIPGTAVKQYKDALEPLFMEANFKPYIDFMMSNIIKLV